MELTKDAHIHREIINVDLSQLFVFHNQCLIYTNIFQNFVIIFSQPGSFLFDRQHIRKKIKTPGFDVESFAPGHKTLGWCNYDAQWILTPRRNL